jgi:hypothetical protein
VPPFAALLLEFVEALHEWPATLCERFATREPLAPVPYERPGHLCKRFTTHEPLAAHHCAKLARIPDFSALSDPLADVHSELQ